jgi:hypothetical protein
MRELSFHNMVDDLVPSLCVDEVMSYQRHQEIQKKNAATRRETTIRRLAQYILSLKSWEAKASLTL